MIVMYANPSFLEYAKLKRNKSSVSISQGAVPGPYRRGTKEKKPLYNIHRTFPNGVESDVDISAAMKKEK
jgi:hypothetical protein